MSNRKQNTDSNDAKRRRMRFSFQFSGADGEAWDWFCRHPQRGAYLKSLILADKERHSSEDEHTPLEEHHTLFDIRWNAQYAVLQRFAAEHGRLPSSTETYHGVNIGRWLNEQKRKKLSAPRVALLAEIGALDGKWEQLYRLVVEFQKEFSRLPKNKESFRDVRVGAWLAMQIKQCDRLDAERVHKLEVIGALQSRWHRNFVILLRFVKQHGRLPKYLDRHGDAQIGRWLNYQCKTLDPTRFPDRAQMLTRLGARLEKGDPTMKQPVKPPVHTEPISSSSLERCILCHKETDIPTDLPIDQRQWYIVGCGQLCKNCFLKTK